jgi:superfamily II RNA helicase
MSFDEYTTNLPFECKTPLKKEELSLDTSYKLDHFQMHSAIALEKDEDVLVLAHTGSGKSTVAEYAIALAMKQNKKVLYASPIKVLSNQKYHDFKKKFGDNIGIMTGDRKLNPDAQIIVMTTEILREMLYQDNEYLKDVKYIVFDEVHYINDRSRGTVWEETLIMIPPEITLVLLSATVDKPEHFASWLGNHRQKKMNLIRTRQRPIPLDHYIYWNKKITHIMNNKGVMNLKNVDQVLAKIKNYNKVNKKRYNFRTELNNFANWLSLENHVPALFFVFSKRRCEEYAKCISDSLINHETRAEVEKLFDGNLIGPMKKYKNLQQVISVKELLMKGIAIHHAGLIPILKEIIELIFEKGLLRLLFATETFAVGVNMPTKTVIFTELDKFDGYIQGKRNLNTPEYLQMAGRAGRRGLDTKGTVIYFPTKNIPSNLEFRQIMTGSQMVINSKFTIDAKTLLKVLNSESQNVLKFVENSFFGKQHASYLKGIINELEQKKLSIQGIEREFNALSGEDKEMKDKYILLRDEIASGKLKKKKRKKKENELKIVISSLSKRTLENITRYENTSKVITKLTNNVKLNELTYGIKYCLDYLHYLEFVKIEDLQNVDITTLGRHNLEIKGIIASEVNHCNELLLGELLIEKVFDDLSIEEIICILATFIQGESDESKLLSDLEIPDSCKEVINHIYELNETLHSKTCNFNMKYESELSYDFLLPTYQWITGVELRVIYENLEMYEGTFIRNMIRVYNFTQEIAKICNILKEFELETKLLKAEQLLIKDIVSFDSIYLL